MSFNPEVTQDACKEALKRLDTLICADPSSPTFGSVDREFWAYRTVRGFSSAPFQHVMSGFAHLANSSDAFDAEFLRNRAISVMDFWLRSRNSSGSVDEWYRNEQSFCATAMGLHSVCETLWLLKEDIEASELKIRCQSLCQTESWLSGKVNPLAANQVVASVSGRFVLGRLLDDDGIADRARDSLRWLNSQFARHGFLPEYGGLDFGYSLLSIDLLAVAHQAGFVECEPLVDDLCRQLCTLVSASGDLPFVLGSRGTAHSFVGGVHYFSGYLSAALELRDRFAIPNSQSQVESVTRYDDRYLATFAFAALARRSAFESEGRPALSRPSTPAGAFVQPSVKHAAGNGGSLYINEALGGALCWIPTSGSRVVHLGYVFTDESGCRWTSLTSVDEERAEYQFVRVSDALPLQKSESLYRLVFLLCRIPQFARLVSWWARTRVGRPNKKCTIWFAREAVGEGDHIMVHDRLRISGHLVGRISRLVSFPFHSPSAVLIGSEGVEGYEFNRVINQWSGTEEISIHWRITTDSSTGGKLVAP